ncbi:UDP-N-acetylmuramoylalanine--D-glutamate ligase [Alteribacillus persepolensis]|uniref:UDP-N-acetylmuramoylalanine--D-glutamate ligase n=1 Tax=Alteribacillus persepolensis TaxID=568899 RepID=A0A1G7YGS4_9BACI|nr:UDP-N-acetylmuramoyl-L-alanine--D-glutamate ligase [Alteribacillus persepolensis]SDG95070.1 UDP-N-acetylmuramoylalanine--D-glutamate ligase [Alteribacillus persepolensis]
MMKTSWFQGKHVLVIGLAKSGMAASKLLRRLGAHVTVNDAKDLTGTEEGRTLKDAGMTVVSGGHPLSLFDSKVDYVVKNPGIRYDTPIIEKAVSLGIPVVTEMELAGLVAEGDILAITGSNGKTTTTTLIYEILKRSNVHAHIAGNIGKVACAVAENTKKDDVMVTEVSSFQLKGTEYFHPKTAVLLNIYDAHLDYHGDRADYEYSKGKIFANLTAGDYAVYNADNPSAASLAQASSAKLIPFSANTEVPEGAYVKDGAFYFQNMYILSVKEAALPGRHNQENMLAAIAASMLHGAEAEEVQAVLKTFTGIEHRLQYVGDVHGRKVYNDSKATNILSTQKAVEAFDGPVVLIAGGLDRGNEFDALIPSLQTVKAAVFYGETRDKLKKAAQAAGVADTVTVDSLTEAVRHAYAYTQENDVLLLSPACASWDQFQTFEERGRCFIEEVNKL